MKTLRFAAAAALVALSCGTAAAQSHLRIGLAEDPDILDPTLARSYVGRIVFAAICDKLFDIDENLKIVPQLATSYEVSARRQGSADQASAGRALPRRREARCRSGEVLARAPSHDEGLVPARRDLADRQDRSGRPARDQARAEGALFAARRSADRSLGHDGVAQGGQGD